MKNGMFWSEIAPRFEKTERHTSTDNFGDYPPPFPRVQSYPFSISEIEIKAGLNQVFFIVDNFTKEKALDFNLC